MTEHLISINDNPYYLDIEAISEFIKISSKDLEGFNKTDKSKKDPIQSTSVINVTKYEIIKMMIEAVFNMGFPLNDTSDMDDTEKLVKGVNDDGFDSLPIPFKLAFNTLIINQIIKSYESTNRKNKRSDSEIKK